MARVLTIMLLATLEGGCWRMSESEAGESDDAAGDTNDTSGDVAGANGDGDADAETDGETDVEPDGESESDGEGDGDWGEDIDPDPDAAPQVDTEADTDAGAASNDDPDSDIDEGWDTEVDTGHFDDDVCEECPHNSGYPCPCDRTCNDGSECTFFDSPFIPEGQGICRRTCQIDSDCEVHWGCSAVGLCFMATPEEDDEDGSLMCSVKCRVQEKDKNTRCPTNMYCHAFNVIQGMCFEK